MIVVKVNSSKKKKKKGKIFLFPSISIFKNRREGKAREFTVLPFINFASRPVNLNDAASGEQLFTKQGERNLVNDLDNFFFK